MRVLRILAVAACAVAALGARSPKSRGVAGSSRLGCRACCSDFSSLLCESSDDVMRATAAG